MFDSVKFFEDCTAHSILARKHNFQFARISGLDSFEEALQSMTTAPALVCASDCSEGVLELVTVPAERRVHTVMLAMRHANHDMHARQQCMNILRELFKQFISRIIREKDQIEKDCQFIDDRITFNEVDRYFFPGCACAYFNITVTTYVDIIFDDSQWLTAGEPQ